MYVWPFKTYVENYVKSSLEWGYWSDLETNNHPVPFLNDSNSFLDSENVYFDIRIDLLSAFQADILALIDLTWRPYWKSNMAAFCIPDEVAPLPKWKLWWWRARGKKLVLLSGVSPFFPNLVLSRLTINALSYCTLRLQTSIVYSAPLP